VNKKVELSILCFRLTIYSEDRYHFININGLEQGEKGLLYKHYLNFYLFNLKLLGIMWRTGRDLNNVVDDGNFHVYGKLSKIIKVENNE